MNKYCDHIEFAYLRMRCCGYGWGIFLSVASSSSSSSSYFLDFGGARFDFSKFARQSVSTATVRHRGYGRGGSGRRARRSARVVVSGLDATVDRRCHERPQRIFLSHSHVNSRCQIVASTIAYLNLKKKKKFL